MPSPSKAIDCSPPPGSEWFKEWFDSPYYHKLYAGRDKQEAAALIDRLLELLHPPPGSAMLDVACGRGRHACILSEHGYDVTGIDIAPGNIDFARQFENGRLRFFVHDMRRLLCAGCFDYAFNFFTSFGYFKTRQEHSNAIRSISVALRKKGVFMLDYLNVRYAKDHLIPYSQTIIDGITFTMTRWCDETHFYKKIRIEEPGRSNPSEYTEKVARFSLQDFTDMFSIHGLEVQQVFGDYALSPYDAVHSPRLLLIAQKT